MDRGLAHNHITGLGVDKDLGTVEGAGLFGMERARKAASIFADMVVNRKIAGKALLISGESGSGKTALAFGLSRELGMRVPFVRMVGSEVYSAEIRKTEILHQAARRAVSLRIREIKRVYEGEIVDLKLEEREDPLNNYRKTVSQIYVSLRSSKGSQRLTLNPHLSQEILKQKISVGDVVYIEADDGVIKKIGRSDTYASEFDIESAKYVPMPKGDIFTKKEVVQETTLHEIDMANARPKGEDTVSVINQLSRSGKIEITEKLRAEVNSKVCSYIETGSAEVIPGVLFIDESHILDMECFSFLSTLLESPMCPVLIFATNKQSAQIGGSEETGPFGMPREFASRLFITRIEPLCPEDVAGIVKEKLKTEKLAVEEAAAQYLCELAQRVSLRFAFNLLPLAREQSPEIITQHVLESVSLLFCNEKSEE
ncbi:RuvB-like protein 1 [Nematocida sp. AWRm77]|nr:RuvB-like protein 1 [Nematocida sp. AWRm77]